MKIKVEVSRPHYHPGPDFDMEVTKKRDLSVPPHWVANERVRKVETKYFYIKEGELLEGTYAIVMPPRDKELYEERQEPHIHMPEYVTIKVKGKEMKARVKVQKGYDFEPKIHFDDVEAEELGIKEGEEAEL